MIRALFRRLGAKDLVTVACAVLGIASFVVAVRSSANAQLPWMLVAILLMPTPLEIRAFWRRMRAAGPAESTPGNAEHGGGMMVESVDTADL